MSKLPDSFLDWLFPNRVLRRGLEEIDENLKRAYALAVAHGTRIDTIVAQQEEALADFESIRDRIRALNISPETRQLLADTEALVKRAREARDRPNEEFDRALRVLEGGKK